MIRIGIDIGSTTAKVVALDPKNETLFAAYRRHNAKPAEVLRLLMGELCDRLGVGRAALCVTGSVGMGVAERHSLPFVQEVAAATKAACAMHPEVRSIIDIGGEDAKIVFINGDRATDLRMNSNCAGGTGAFIDQMAILLGVDADGLDRLADAGTGAYAIASRCGVFSKTDVQNLMAKGATREDIAASVFHAVAVQVVAALARGCDICPPVLFCGGAGRQSPDDGTRGCARSRRESHVQPCRPCVRTWQGPRMRCGQTGRAGANICRRGRPCGVAREDGQGRHGAERTGNWAH